MANWRFRLELKDVWEKADKREITPQELSIEVAKRILEMPCNKDIHLRKIAKEFKDIATDKDLTFDDFDITYNKLCDWGDQEIKPFGKWPPNKMCWINTLF